MLRNHSPFQPTSFLVMICDEVLEATGTGGPKKPQGRPCRSLTELDQLYAKVDQAIMLLRATDAATSQAHITELEEASAQSFSWHG